MERQERDPRYDAEKRTRARELYESGMTTDEVAAELGVTRSWAVDLLHESGARMRPRGRPRKRRQKRRERR